MLLMAAAVADFRPVDPAATKLKKAGRERLTLELESTADVLSALAARRRAGQTLVGFAAEHGPQAVSYARAQARAKGLDAVVANDVSRSDAGFEVEHNEVVVVTAPARSHLARAPKERIAEGILDVLADLRPPPEPLRELQWMQMPDHHEDSVYELYKRGSELLSARRPPRRDRAAHARARPRAHQDLDPRGPRQGALSRPALRGRRGGVRGRRRPPRPPTTMRSSASGARCSCSAGTARPATRSRSPAPCRRDREDYRIYRDRARRAASIEVEQDAPEAA